MRNTLHSNITIRLLHIVILQVKCCLRVFRFRTWIFKRRWSWTLSVMWNSVCINFALACYSIKHLCCFVCKPMILFVHEFKINLTFHFPFWFTSEKLVFIALQSFRYFSNSFYLNDIWITSNPGVIYFTLHFIACTGNQVPVAFANWVAASANIDTYAVRKKSCDVFLSYMAMFKNVQNAL